MIPIHDLAAARPLPHLQEGAIVPETGGWTTETVNVDRLLALVHIPRGLVEMERVTEMATQRANQLVAEFTRRYPGVPYETVIEEMPERDDFRDPLGQFQRNHHTFRITVRPRIEHFLTYNLTAGVLDIY